MPSNGNGLGGRECRFCSAAIERGDYCKNCDGLFEHLSTQMRYRGWVRLRTSKRTPEQAQFIMEAVAYKLGLGIEFEQGDSWVSGKTNGTPTSVPREPRKQVDGFVLEDLDPIRLEVELDQSRQRVNLRKALAEIDDLSAQRLPEELERLKTLEHLVEEKRAAGKV